MVGGPVGGNARLKNELEHSKRTGIVVVLIFIFVLLFGILGLATAPRAEFLLFMGLAIIAGGAVLFLDKETVVGGVAVMTLGVVLMLGFFLV